MASCSDEAFRRATQKKLRQIADLKSKHPHFLNAAQKEKLSKEVELLAQLEEINKRLGVQNEGRADDEDERRPSIDVGMRVRVDGQKAKVRKLGEGGDSICVKFKETGDKEWLTLPSDRVELIKGEDDEQAESQTTREEEPSRLQPTPPRPPLPSSGAIAPPAPPGTCGHCGRIGHTPRVCSFGLAAEGERFLSCGRVGAAPCFPRIFIVPLRRASAHFDCDDLRSGRVDVGLRCVNAALFRSQSLRQNTQVVLCFGDYSAGGVGGEGGAPRLVELHGAMVRDLRPDEASLAKRIRAIATEEGAAEAEALAAAAREAHTRGGATDDGPLGRWSRGEHRGLRSLGGGMLDAVRRSLEAVAAAAPGVPPVLLLLSPTGEPIGSLCAELVPAPPGGVIVLLGDDRGLTDAEEREVLRLAAAGGATVRRVSLGEDVLFASHSIVIVHHHLDNALHSCAVRPPRVLVRGGGRGGARGGGRTGTTWGRGRGGGKGAQRW